MIQFDTFNDADQQALESFLDSDRTPVNCMDISMLHGFFTSLVIGPETVMPSDWLPMIWQETEGDEMIWDSLEETQRIIGLIMKFFNSISDLLLDDPDSFSLLLYNYEDGKETVPGLEEWCKGFLTGVNMTLDAWDPIMENEETARLMLPFIVYGPQNNRPGEMKKTAEDIDNGLAVIPYAVTEIYKFWLPNRRDLAEATHRAVARPSVGRNDPCPCGSGKKFKKCCMN